MSGNDYALGNLAEEILGIPTTYLVTYRLADTTTANGSRDDRYEAVVAKLRDFEGAEPNSYFEDAGHTSTSSWMIKTTTSAKTLLNHLQTHLTPGVDLLEVVEVNLNNRARMTRA
ncbi:hypothetical protein HUE56_04550 (plasmid) [Azospirillum oryzae]|uniref:Uncharacterized protein n=1 Tax=Azospirillum oryzae TaxID=286727 RepID=A0A6N1AF34_9PROT|nr:hypothetical protein [Azospirillum oryzae]KAA0584508.1 hypothetical protein FZ938_29500 [Azospirillum oryzae]QKS49809.1 hypothetical protein HUE56_04550 [Azospirillum oryzae]GLR79072.1 hypothetical protein GCM10007856_17460 [Azospirillum oryzae]